MSIPKNWQPEWDEQTTRRNIKRYEGQAHRLSEEENKQLQQHAEAYGIPNYTGDFSLLDAIGQAGAGFIEGFTTLNIMDHPDNEYEQIARNLGHLAGFAPGIMSKPAALLGKTAIGKAMGARNFAKAASQLKSGPMRVADFATKHAKQALKTSGKAFNGRSSAVSTAKNFIMGDKARHIVEGSFHLGVASAVSQGVPWQGGVDGAMQGFIGGAKAGAIFRAIGNMTPGTKAHEKLTKAVAGSLFMGLPSTMRGDTTPEQVYEYAMGAYFGGNEVSWATARAMKAMKDMGKKAELDPEWRGKSGMDPELWEGFDKLPEPVKPILLKEAKKAWGDESGFDANREGWLATELLKQLGLEGEVTEAKLKEAGYEPTGEYKDGEQVYKPNLDIIKERFKTYVTSGGDEGANTEFARQAEKVGIPTINYTFGGHAKKIKATGFQRVLTTSELEEADGHIREANKSLGRFPVGPGKSQNYIQNLQRRGWFQIKHSNAVYAVGDFVPGNTTRTDKKTGEKTYIKSDTQVKGNTGLTVQMAIDSQKPVYFFSQASKAWYKWNQGANKGFGQFTFIKTPPKPPLRFAGIGTSKNLTPVGKQAIQSLFENNWKPIQPVTETIAKNATEEAKKVTIKKLEKDIEESQELIRELTDDVTEKNLQGIDTAQAEGYLADAQLKNQRLVEKRNRLTAPPADGVTPESLNKETISNEISDKADTEFEVASDLEIGKRSLQFTSKHLGEFTSGSLTVLDAQGKKLEVSQLVQKVLEDTDEGGNPLYLRRNSKENLSEEWANALEKRLKDTYNVKDFKLKPEARLELRQWMTRKNTGKIVTHLQSDGKTVFKMSNPNNPISRAGNRKAQEEPIKEIEIVYSQKGGKEGESAYVVLDHVTITGEKGNRDLDLSAYRNNHLLRENKYDEGLAAKAYGKFLGDAIKKMAKDNYYIFGGTSDKDRIIWMKHNPEVDKLTPTEVASKIENTIKDISKNSEVKLFGKHLEQSATEFIAKYGSDKQSFNKMWLSNLYYDLHLNGMEANAANIKTVLTHPGFIKDSAAFNKRQQIWMNNAWSGDIEFIKKQGVNLTTVIDKETGVESENYNYLIVKDLATAVEKAAKDNPKFFQNIKRLNSELPENVDGAIIVTNKVLDAMNADFGNPQTGQNKSFIVSPNAKNGALLGKYMMHAAGDKMSELMEAKGLHMIMQETAVKQRGLRNYKTDKKGKVVDNLGDYDIVNGELKFDKKQIFNDLSPEHVKGNFGVYGNTHMLENQRLPKQLLQNLLPTTWKEVPSEVIEQMFDKIIQKRWDGDKVVNARLDSYLEMAREGQVSSKKLENFELDLINNIDKIGINKLVEAMKHDYAPGLSEAIYNKILKIEKNASLQRFAEGDITEEQLMEEQSEIVEFNSIADRLIRNANEWVSERKSAGVNANVTAVYMHKFIRDFRIKAVQNYLINSATKPKRDNSASGFMRPYDKAMRQDLDKANPRLKELETNDEIFFLDNKFEAVKMQVELTGAHKKITTINLGDLWNLYTKGDKNGKLSAANKEYVEDVFEAVTVRTPMDSMSGAQVLKFAGFTGRNGHGVLLHGRAMRAEGGADLDGDKSSIFFGGKNGFDKQWKKAYKDNKQEFYSKPDKKGVITVSDNKDALMPKLPYLQGTQKKYRDILAISPNDKQKSYLTSKASQYSPTERIRISESAVNGRNQLGPAVVNKQIMASAYSAIIANGGKDKFQVKVGYGKNTNWYDITIKTRNTAIDKAHQRQMGRAQIGLASDPLDELGLSGNKKWFKEMWEAHFEITEIKSKGKTKKKLTEDEANDIFGGNILESSAIKGGILGNLNQINRAYWGRNWSAGRKFNMEEILDLGGAISDIPLKSKKSSFLVKTGELLHGLDWSDSIFGKISKENLQEVYSEHLNRVESYDWLKSFLGRPSFNVKKNAYIENVLTFDLWTPHGVNKTARSQSDFLKAIKGTMFHNIVKKDIKKYFGTKNNTVNLGGLKELQARRDILVELKKLGEDFVVNDMTDLASITNISELITRLKNKKDTILLKGNKSLEESVNEMQDLIENLKINSYLMAKDRGSVERFLNEKRDFVDTKFQKEFDKIDAFYNEYYNIKPKKTKSLRALGDEPTAELDQTTIDLKIKEYKDTLTPGGQALFDQMMLGSMNRGDIEAINKFEKGMGKADAFTMEVLKGLRAIASKTRVSRLGFNSNAIADVSIKQHIGAFANNFKEGHIPKSKAQKNELDTFIENYESRVEDNIIDPALTEALMPTGYEGLKKGKIDKENTQIVTEIADILKEMHNKDSRDINGLVRGIVGKDLNAMNKQDFKVFRNWLQDIRSGNFVQRMFHKKGPVELNKRHWALFPKAVNRELMRDDLVMMKEKGFFKNKFGKMEEGTITRPTHYIDIVQNFIGKMNDASVNVSDRYIKKFNENMLFHSGLEDSPKLWEIAVRMREAHPEYMRELKQNLSGKDPEVVKRAIIEINARKNEALKENDWNNLQKKEYMVSVEGVRKEITGAEIVKIINRQLTDTFSEMYSFIKGKTGSLDAYKFQSPKGGVKYDYKKFLKHLQEHVSGRTPAGWKKDGIADVPTYFGIDGLRKIARSMQIDRMLDPVYKKEIAAQEVGDTGQTNPEAYFPHMFFDAVKSKKLMKETLQKIIDKPESEMTDAQKKDEIKKLYYKNKSLGSELRFEEMEDWNLYDEVLQDIAEGKKANKNKLKWFNSNESAGSMRTREVHMGGWSIDPVVVESYIRSLSNTYHRQLNQMFGREQVYKMFGQMLPKWGKEQTNAWQDFMKLYIQDAIGNPSIIPQYMYDNPTMKLKGTPYGWWSDNKVRDRINKFGKAIGLGNKKLPEELRGATVEDLRMWSNLEAQYNMATLLAHPKSAAMNVLGGATHTIQSTGIANYLKARNFSYLATINPKWTNKQALNDFVVSQGVLPEYLVYEMGLQKEFQNTKGKKFLQELTAKLSRDPEMGEKSIGEIASNYGLKDKAMNFAAKFMTLPERGLRRDSFMAHYIQAWEKYGSAIKEYDHPYLIALAKKGVKATQFLYNAPFRPAFARTSFGKFMSRFQLWSWNSVRFRNDVRREARIYGYEPGTEEYRRFQRTLQTDLFAFALGNIYAYSLFETNLPAPWNWVQDSADWIFGDEKTRDKAFYGAYPTAVAPLQAITPPGLRMIGPVAKALINDDWSKMGSYYAYTMMPFGRIIRDVAPFSPTNVFNNPMSLPRKLFGVPMMQFQEKASEMKEDEEQFKVPYEAIR